MEDRAAHLEFFNNVVKRYGVPQTQEELDAAFSKLVASFPETKKVVSAPKIVVEVRVSIEPQ